MSARRNTQFKIYPRQVRCAARHADRQQTIRRLNHGGRTNRRSAVCHRGQRKVFLFPDAAHDPASGILNAEVTVGRQLKSQALLGLEWGKRSNRVGRETGTDKKDRNEDRPENESGRTTPWYWPH